MQRNIDYHYKSFDFTNIQNLDRKRYGTFNEYGYNLDGTHKRVLNQDKLATKSKDNNVKAHNIREKN